jgi:hypothetical protein
MQLLVSWKKSLALFLPHNFKQFIGNVCNVIKKAYPLWLRYWWIFIAPLFILLCINPNFDIGSYACLFFGIDIPLHVNQLQTLLVYVLWLQFYFALFLASRPSSAPKDWMYFKSYFCHRWYGYVLLWFFAMPYLWKLISLLGNVTSFKQIVLEIPGTPWQIAPFDIITILSLIIITATFQFYILFLLDSDASVMQSCKLLWRSLKMTLYNLPFCILMAGLLFGIQLLLTLPIIILFEFLYTQTHNHLWYSAAILSSHLLMLFIFLPLLVSIASVFYANRKAISDETR